MRTQLVALRPEISSIVHDRSSNVIEQFQNKTLRPILKFQDHLLRHLFKNALSKHKIEIGQIPINKRNEIIKDIIQKDRSLCNVLLGTIIGHFTDDELSAFLSHEKQIKKRISDMLIQRIQSHY